MSSPLFRRRASAAGAVLAVAATAALAPPASGAGLGAASPLKGELDVFLRHDGDGTGSDPNAASLVMVRRVDGFWRSPVNLGGNLHQDSEVAVTSPGTGKLTVAVRWTDNTLRTRDWSSTSGWGPWSGSVVGNITGGPALASYGGGNVLATWRGPSGSATFKVRPAGGAWPAYGTVLSAPAAAGTGPSARPYGSSSVAIEFVPSYNARPMESAWTDQSEGIENATAWNSAAGDQQSDFLTVPAMPSKQTLAVGAGIFAAGGTDRHVVQLVEGAPGTTGSLIDMGGTVAGSTATSRPGESTIPNTPASLRTYQFADSTAQRYELFWRGDNGCLNTRTSGSLTPLSAWAASSQVPTQVASSRCVWPARTGTMGLMRRNSPATDGDLYNAESAFYPAPSANSYADWYTSRYQALVYHQTGNWQTAWDVRNWHPNAWVYRKSTSYLGTDGPDNSPTVLQAHPDFFVKAAGSTRFLAINYDCTSSGCTQPLLDVTKPAARRFWLYGDSTATNAADLPTSGECRNQKTYMGILELLACTRDTNPSAGQTASDKGNAKGVWLDDVLAQLGEPTSDAASYITFFDGKGTTNTAGANGAAGPAIKGNQVATYLPFSAATWDSSLATMLEELRAGINQLKAAGRLRADQGKIAINWHWDQYGESWATPQPNLSSPAMATPARIISAADFVELEHGWLDENIVGGDASTVRSFARHASFIDQVHALGRNVIAEKAYSEPDGDATYAFNAGYNLASALLTYGPGDMVGDIGDKYGRGYLGYTLDLGQPTASRSALVAAYPTGAQQRVFENGRVVVAPPGPPACTGAGGATGCLTTTGSNAGKVVVTLPAGSRCLLPGATALAACPSTSAITPRQAVIVIAS